METKKVIAQKEKLLKDMKAWMMVDDDSLEFGLWYPEKIKDKAEMLSSYWQLQFDNLYEVANNLLVIAGTFVHYKNTKYVSFADLAVIEFCLKHADEARDKLLKFIKGFKKIVLEEEEPVNQQLLIEIWPIVSGQILSMAADMTLLTCTLKKRYQDIIEV